jgi:hypothetical protein
MAVAVKTSGSRRLLRVWFQYLSVPGLTECSGLGLQCTLFQFQFQHATGHSPPCAPESDLLHSVYRTVGKVVVWNMSKEHRFRELHVGWLQIVHVAMRRQWSQYLISETNNKRNPVILLRGHTWTQAELQSRTGRAASHKQERGRAKGWAPARKESFRYCTKVSPYGSGAGPWLGQDLQVCVVCLWADGFGPQTLGV